MKIIPVDDHLDELVGHHKGKDHTREGMMTLSERLRIMEKTPAFHAAGVNPT